MIYTFYSFKGGVGRSMALANVAELLYRRGFKVLMVDFDLEAPGLEGYFEVPEAQNKPGDILTRRGVIDMLVSYKELRLLSSPLPLSQTLEPPTPQRQKDFPFPVEPITNFITPIYQENEIGGRLSIIPAGRRAGSEFTNYAQRVRSFDWDDFYTNWDGEQFFEWFRRETERQANVVLIDSRTGVTEMSGVCAYQLADVVIMFVTPNQQNLDGTLMMARSLANPQLVSEGRQGRPLSLLFVPSRVEQGEKLLLDEFEEQFNRVLNSFIAPRFKFEKSAFIDLKIPYVPYYAYKESVATREPERASESGLVEAFEKLASILLPFTPETFSPSLFAGRQRELDDLIRWVTDPSGVRRLRTIAAPPGYGKTWLLRELERRLINRRDLFIISVPVPASKLISRVQMVEWLSFVVRNAQIVYPTVRDIGQFSPEIIISNLLEDLTQASPPLHPILLVDGFDELQYNERRELEKCLLDQFWLNPAARIIVSLRDESVLASTNLRRGEERVLLRPFSEKEGHQQLEELLDLKVKDSKYQEILKLIAPYTLNIPGLNAILVERIQENIKNNRQPILTAADLRACWHELIGPELNRQPEAIEFIERDIQAIIALPQDSWTFETFAVQGKYLQRDALNHIQMLMALGIVCHAGGQKYTVIDGLRQILQAEQRLKETEREYDLDNIRVLLTENFTDIELGRFCLERPEFRIFYNESWPEKYKLASTDVVDSEAISSSRGMSKTEFADTIDQLIKHASRKDYLDILLDWAKKPKPDISAISPLRLPQLSWKLDLFKPRPILPDCQISRTLKGYDPFPNHQAEHELAFLFGEVGGFWSDRGHPAYAAISANFSPELILGESGSGKTACAYALSQLGDVEGKPLAKTLPIYLRGEQVALRDIHKEVALALFNFGRANPAILLDLSPDEQKLLARFWLNSLEAEIVKPRLTQLFAADRNVTRAIQRMKAASWKNQKQWLLAVQDMLRLFHFDRAVLAVDFNEAKPEETLVYLQNMPGWAAHALIIKLFLPAGLAPEIKNFSGNVRISRLTWTDDLLAEMARWRYDSLARLAGIHGGPDLLFDEGVYVQFIQQAKGNPRCLAQLWRFLFDDHLAHSPERPTFSAENLAQAVEKLNNESDRR
ncbi:MAG: hypothetical protein JW953_21665 [Anaerolineae bacterium]|nr:hypothetical protein [Anaerolineae bacterium]